MFTPRYRLRKDFGGGSMALFDGKHIIGVLAGRVETNNANDRKLMSKLFEIKGIPTMV